MVTEGLSSALQAVEEVRGTTGRANLLIDTEPVEREECTSRTCIRLNLYGEAWCDPRIGTRGSPGVTKVGSARRLRRE